MQATSLKKILYRLVDYRTVDNVWHKLCRQVGYSDHGFIYLKVTPGVYQLFLSNGPYSHKLASGRIGTLPYDIKNHIIKDFLSKSSVSLILNPPKQRIRATKVIKNRNQFAIDTMNKDKTRNRGMPNFTTNYTPDFIKPDGNEQSTTPTHNDSKVEVAHNTSVQQDNIIITFNRDTEHVVIKDTKTNKIIKAPKNVIVTAANNIIKK